jgi:hypothetical protein
MKRDEFKRFDARMYRSAKKIIDVGDVCVGINCIVCPASRLNVLNNTIKIELTRNS